MDKKLRKALQDAYRVPPPAGKAAFLKRRRRRELGLYGVLGLERRHVGAVLLFETLYSLTISLVVGLGAGLLLAMLITPLAGFGQRCAQVRQEVLRLHILANSDSEADQALKLRVRDAVLEETGGNQTAAAKRLGISRTTLWRLVKKQMGPSSAHEK